MTSHILTYEYSLHGAASFLHMFTTIFDNSANCLENFKVVHRIPYTFRRSVDVTHFKFPNLAGFHTVSVPHFSSFRRSVDVIHFNFQNLTCFQSTPYFDSFRHSVDVKHVKFSNIEDFQSLFRILVRSAVPWMLYMSSFQTWQTFTKFQSVFRISVRFAIP